MRILLFSFALFPFLIGCNVTSSARNEETFQEKKIELEREIEILRLERRKILLQNSLDHIDGLNVPGMVDPEDE